MPKILSLRPFVPAKDFDLSIAFYEALGFVATHKDSSVAILQLADAGFVLQNYYVKACADILMVQLLVTELDDWWALLDVADLASRFSVKAPISPAMQSWGLRVGFIFDPSGVLWHVVQPPV